MLRLAVRNQIARQASDGRFKNRLGKFHNLKPPCFRKNNQIQPDSLVLWRI